MPIKSSVSIYDPYNVSFSILCKVPGIYMKLDDQFPFTREFKIFVMQHS